MFLCSAQPLNELRTHPGLWFFPSPTVLCLAFSLIALCVLRQINLTSGHLQIIHSNTDASFASIHADCPLFRRTNSPRKCPNGPKAHLCDSPLTRKQKLYAPKDCFSQNTHSVWVFCPQYQVRLRVRHLV